MKASRIIDYIIHPDKIVIALGSRGVLPFISDRLYLRIFFWSRLNYHLDLENPRSFNEKIQWLKLNDHNPSYCKYVDKAEAKKIVSNIIGEKYIIPTYGVWDKYEDIDFDSLPDQFVIKCTHDSGGVVVVKNKKTFDSNAAHRLIASRLRKNYYYLGREWPYKNITPRVIVEKYMEESDKRFGELIDYKIMCFNGNAKLCFTCTDRFNEGLKVTFFDRDWQVMPFERHYPKSDKEIQKPYSFDLMIELAEKIAKNFPFARIDFYEIDKQPYFGEVTLYPGTGVEEFSPIEWDYTLGSWLDLSNVRENQA